MYVKQKKASPKDGTVKYYPILKTIRQVGEKEVAQLLSEETTLNPREAEMALAQLEKVMLRLLMAGYSVKMGDWASFHVTATGEGSATEKECNGSKVKRIRVQCRMSKTFLEKLQGADLQLVQDLETKTKKKTTNAAAGE